MGRGGRNVDDLDETSQKILESTSSGTSIFDPVLCELAYRWFCPDGGLVLDPFAGGSVRGVVASKLGYQYVGIELRAEQVAANRVQADDICQDPVPVWVNGDSMNLDSLANDVEADLVFSCPPYADLERYSDDPKDLSTMPYEAFVSAYRAIISKAVAKLKDNRFVCLVVGDIRDKKGFYRNFVGDTVQAVEDAGATLYNEAILVTAVGSLPIRVGKQFSTGRKLGKTHQNVLVFYKGDPKKIRDHFRVDIQVGAVPEGDGDGKARQTEEED
jgi:DNA modification methylase